MWDLRFFIFTDQRKTEESASAVPTVKTATETAAAVLPKSFRMNNKKELNAGSGVRLLVIYDSIFANVMNAVLVVKRC